MIANTAATGAAGINDQAKFIGDFHQFFVRIKLNWQRRFGFFVGSINVDKSESRLSIFQLP